MKKSKFLREWLSLKLFCIRKLHSKALATEFIYSEYHMAWYAIFLGLNMMMPNMGLTQSFEFLTHSIPGFPIIILGFIFIILGLNDILSLTGDSRRWRINSVRANVMISTMMFLIASIPAFEGNSSLGIFCFGFYLLHQARILKRTISKKINGG